MVIDRCHQDTKEQDEDPDPHEDAQHDKFLSRKPTDKAVYHGDMATSDKLLTNTKVLCVVDGILRVMKFWLWNKEHLPQGNPVVYLPDPEMDPVLMGERFDQIERDLEQWRAEERKRFEAALVRIELCAFMRGFTNPFGTVAMNRHYSWCPSEKWLKKGYAGIEWKIPAH